MNYRHAFHAGNFADVVKHATLVLLIERLKAKEAAFRVIDTHARPGLYDLTGDEATRTGEWHNGIGRIVGRKFVPPMDGLMAPYLATVAAANEGKKGLSRYPGSPWLIRHLLRKQDRLTAVELHPDDAAGLVAAGADGIWVSNHGGRQLDGAASSFDAIEAIHRAVGDQVPILLDSGVRTGMDVIKAKARGAAVCAIGRAALFGAAEGRAGVERVLDILLEEIAVGLKLCGAPGFGKVGPQLIAPARA